MQRREVLFVHDIVFDPGVYDGLVSSSEPGDAKVAVGVVVGNAQLNLLLLLGRLLRCLRPNSLRLTDDLLDLLLRLDRE